MSRANTTQDALLGLILRGAGRDGIYGLARSAGRPYRRVHAQVHRLAAGGLVRLEPSPAGGRLALRVLPFRARPPVLHFNRAWSRPSGGVDAPTVIAQVLARPTFRDLLACVRAYGGEVVERTLEAMVAELELPAGAAQTSRRMLANIELGRARAASSD